MSEDIDEEESQVQAQTSLYLAESMFPAFELPSYAGISTKLEAKHYSAVEASTQLGENIIDFIKELLDLREKHKETTSKYDNKTTKITKNKEWDKYVKDAKNIKIKINKSILQHYRVHTKNQLTHGVSVKGRGRLEATGIQTSHKTGTTAPIHKRSKWEKLTGKNKEPTIGEQPNTK